MSDLPKGSFRLEGHIDVPADRIAQVSEALKEHLKLTREEEGCILFNVDACSKVQGRFLVSEAFVDEAAFQFHQERAGASPWAEASAGVPRDYKTWVVK
jgi:quinol monooxygenase YgiN